MFAAVGTGRLLHNSRTLLLGDPSFSHKPCGHAFHGLHILTVIFPRPVAGTKLADATAVGINDLAGWCVRTLIEIVPDAIVIAIQTRAGNNWLPWPRLPSPSFNLTCRIVRSNRQQDPAVICASCVLELHTHISVLPSEVTRTANVVTGNERLERVEFRTGIPLKPSISILRTNLEAGRQGSNWAGYIGRRRVAKEYPVGSFRPYPKEYDAVSEGEFRAGVAIKVHRLCTSHVKSVWWKPQRNGCVGPVAGNRALRPAWLDRPQPSGCPNQHQIESASHHHIIYNCRRSR